MSREAGSHDGHFSERELEGSKVPEVQPPSKTVWGGQKGRKERGRERERLRQGMRAPVP